MHYEFYIVLCLSVCLSVYPIVCLLSVIYFYLFVIAHRALNMFVCPKVVVFAGLSVGTETWKLGDDFTTMVSDFPPYSDDSSTPVAIPSTDRTNLTYYRPYSREQEDPVYANQDTTMWNFNLPSATWTSLNQQLFITRNDMGGQAIPGITTNPCAP
jgi:hypothetical protein